MNPTRFAAACLVALATASTATAQQAVVLVRHAEKVDQSKDAALSPAGQARAKALAALLSRSGVTTIYATQYRRTQETARPLADATGLQVETVSADAPGTLIDRIRAARPTDVVVVVGHSNTLPDILARLGDPVTEQIADEDFGSVFLLVPRPGGVPAVLRLHY